MGQIGFPELIMIFVIALLVFGPKKLPELGKSLGKGLKEFKRATDEMKSTWHEQMKDVERSVEDVKRDVEKSVEDVKTSVNEVTSDIKPDLDFNSETYKPYEPVPPTSEPAKDKESKEVHQAQ